MVFDMGFLTKTKGSIISDYFKLLDPLGKNSSGDMIDVALYDDHLIMKGGISKQEITLNYKQITDVFYGFKTEIIQSNASVIGRAVTGGLLFGNVGAVVGAASAVGAKEKAEKGLFFIISYTSSNGEDSFIRFEDTRRYKGKKVAAELKKMCNIVDTNTMAL